MNKYELTVVLPSGTSDTKIKSAKESVEKLIEGLKGKVEKTDEWGEIELAYEISGNKSGIFSQFLLELDPASIKSVDDKLRHKEDIIRYLLVKKE